jgi:glucose-6-phosphate 1-dehydrogenase
VAPVAGSWFRKVWFSDPMSHFTREDAVEATWSAVEPVLEAHNLTRPYKRGTWGPREADALIAADGCWHNPKPGTCPDDVIR